MSRLMDLSYRALDGARHHKAAEVSRQPPRAADFEGLRSARQAILVTFKRSGEPVPTPVNFGLSEDGKLYFRSEPQVAKIRRIRNNSRVLIGACNVRGKPRGPLAVGTARILPSTERKQAYTLIRANWSPAMWPGERALDILGVQVVYVEVTAAGAQDE